MGKDKHRLSTTGLAITASLVLHLMLLWFFPSFFKQEVAPQKSASRTASVVFRDKKQDIKPVVSVSPQALSERPKDARYFADIDQKTDKEQKTAPTPNSPLKNPVPPKQHAESKDDSLGNKSKKRDDPLGIKYKPADAAEGGGSQATSDHLPDVQEGDKTELNAWQWRHAPFFNRIKSMVGKIWSPNVQIARYDPKGELLGQLDRVTVMQVTIDTEGNLTSLKLASSSGVAYLDEEAERTFREAAPFPFPPKELFNGSSEFSFRFAFHLEINRGLKFEFEW